MSIDVAFVCKRKKLLFFSILLTHFKTPWKKHKIKLTNKFMVKHSECNIFLKRNAQYRFWACRVPFLDSDLISTASLLFCFGFCFVCVILNNEYIYFLMLHSLSNKQQKKNMHLTYSNTMEFMLYSLVSVGRKQLDRELVCWMHMFVPK